MSLHKCRDCGHKVAFSAKVCPSCGSKDPVVIVYHDPYNGRFLCGPLGDIGMVLLLLLPIIFIYLIDRNSGPVHIDWWELPIPFKNNNADTIFVMLSVPLVLLLIYSIFNYLSWSASES